MMLPSNLALLAKTKTLCPELGLKGSITHDDVQVSNIERLEYMKIRILGGVKAQDINLRKYNIDIDKILTLSALAIFRTDYYDLNSFYFFISKTCPMPGLSGMLISKTRIFPTCMDLLRLMLTVLVILRNLSLLIRIRIIHSFSQQVNSLVYIIAKSFNMLADWDLELYHYTKGLLV